MNQKKGKKAVTVRSWLRSMVPGNTYTRQCNSVMEQDSVAVQAYQFNSGEAFDYNTYLHVHKSKKRPIILCIECVSRNSIQTNN